MMKCPTIRNKYMQVAFLVIVLCGVIIFITNGSISDGVKNRLEAASFVATSVGIFIALVTYIQQSRKERLDREYGTFHDIDDKYVEFMYKCSDNLDLDLFSTSKKSAIGDAVISQYLSGLNFNNEVIEEMNKERRVKERALYSVLISIFERAYVMFYYRCNDADEMKERQLEGWNECMRSYCLRPSFLYEWNIIGKQFDQKFYIHMQKIINDTISVRYPSLSS